MSRPSLRSMMRQPRRQGQHRRIRSLERRADDSEAERAQLRADVRDIKAALLTMGVPLDGEIPAELTCAIAAGCRGPVTLDVAGQTVVAGLDPDRPGDVVEIWRAIKTVASKQAS
jgi:hypothetical protein